MNQKVHNHSQMENTHLGKDAQHANKRKLDKKEIETRVSDESVKNIWKIGTK